MPKHKPVHPIFNNRWQPVLIFIAWILISHLNGIAANIWRGFFDGTVYGRVIMENGDVDPQQFENIEISWLVGYGTKQSNAVFTNSKGEYRFEREVPIEYHITMTAKYGNNCEIEENVGAIEGVKWLLGIRGLRLPISSGIPKRVDFVIPSISSSTVGNPQHYSN